MNANNMRHQANRAAERAKDWYDFAIKYSKSPYAAVRKRALVALSSYYSWRQRWVQYLNWAENLPSWVQRSGHPWE